MSSAGKITRKSKSRRDWDTWMEQVVPLIYISGEVSAKKYKGEPRRWEKYAGKNALRPALLSNPPRDHIELCPSPEERPAHTESIAIGNASGPIVGGCLLDDVDRSLSGEQRYV